MNLSNEQVVNCRIAFSSLSDAEGTAPLALVMMQTAVRQAPDCIEFRQDSRNFFIKRGERAEALPHLKCAVKIEPDDLELRGDFVNVLFGLSKYKDSIEHLAYLALHETVREAYWHNQIGFAYYKIGDLDSAICAFQTALHFEPENPVFRGNLGHVLCDVERFDEAIPHLEVAIEHYPEHFGLRHDLGYSLNELGRFAEAIPHLDHAAKLEPENPVVRNNLGYALNNEKRFSEAIPHLECAVKLDPENIAFRNNLAYALQAHDDPNDKADDGPARLLFLHSDCLHSGWSRHAQHGQAIVQYLRGGGDQRQAGLLHGLVVHQDALGVVVAVVAGGKVAQVEGHIVRGFAVARSREHFGVLGQLQHQRLGLWAFESRQINVVQRSHVATASLLPRAQHRLDAGMRVLHVVHGVVVVLCHGQVRRRCTRYRACGRARRNARRRRAIRLALENFLRFAHRYWFHEISNHSQVRGLFDMTRRHLDLDGLYSEVREELQDMGSFLDVEAMRRQNDTVVRLTVVTTFGLIGTVTTGFLGMNLFGWAEEPASWRLLAFFVIFLPVVVLTLYTLMKSKPLSEFLDAMSDETATYT